MYLIFYVAMCMNTKFIYKLYIFLNMPFLRRLI
jgi:hypothetical protein